MEPPAIQNNRPCPVPEVRSPGEVSAKPLDQAVESPMPDQGGRIVAVMSYVPVAGLLVAMLMNANRKTHLGAFHLRQSLGLHAAVLALAVFEVVLAAMPLIGWLFIPLLWLLLVFLFVAGLVGAIAGRQQPVPLVGESYQRWFAKLFG